MRPGDKPPGRRFGARHGAVGARIELSRLDRIGVDTIGQLGRFTERVARLQRDRGVTREEIDQRLKAQMSQEEKASRADYVIDNSGDLEGTRQQVARVHGELME